MKISRRLARLLAAIAAAVTFGSLVAACGLFSSGGGDTTDATYAPVSYWQTVDNVRSCFYFGTDLNDGLAQVALLQAAGLCPAGSMPVAAPLYWSEEYYPYYSSPAYYNAYVPASDRTTYTHVTVVKFSSTYNTQIKAASSNAVYRSSAGGTVKGPQVSATRFGGGSRTTTSYGGGARGGSTSAPVVRSTSKAVTYSAGRH